MMKPMAERIQKIDSFASVSMGFAISRPWSRPFKALLVCSIVLLTLAHSRAQSGGATGTIVGTVVDATGALIPGARVSITEA
jgi:hypothetical protein